MYCKNNDIWRKTKLIGLIELRGCTLNVIVLIYGYMNYRGETI